MTDATADGARPRAPYKLVVALSTAGLLSGTALAAVHMATAPRIADNHERALEGAVLAVVPRARSYEALALTDGAGEGVAYITRDAEGRVSGFAVPAEGPGFMDTIRLLYGLDPRTGRVVGLRVVDSRETPGLGDKIMSDPAFTGSFTSLSVEPRIVPVTRGAPSADNEVDCISGATVSSKAVVQIVQSSLDRWLALLEARAEEMQ